MAHPTQPQFSDDTSLISLCRDEAVVRVPAALVAVVTFLALILSPGVEAAHDAAEQSNAETSQAQASPDPLAQLMHRLEGRVAAVLTRAEADELEQVQTDLEALHAEMADIGAEIAAQFQAERDRLQGQDLPPAVMQRQDEAAQLLRDRVDGLLAAVEAICQADSIEEAQPHASMVRDMLHHNPVSRRHQPFNPDALPFSPATPTPRTPESNDDDLRQSLDEQAWHDALQPGGSPLQVAALGGAASALAGIAAAAQLGANQLPPSDPAYLAPTEDVQITDDIRALAATLNNHPVEIFNWVNSQIDYIPGHKSIQGSQRTLETRRGNAFDQASLLIALYRAAGIPARYVYGTVEVDESAARNWLGNLESPIAAGNLLNGGGAPVAALSNGGVIEALRLEHVWVEAYVDFYPSRGAVNRQPDAWAAVDPSFKQYAYTEGLDLEQAVPFDAQGFVDELLASAQIDETSGTVNGLDTALIDSRFEQYLNQLETHIADTVPDANVGDVIGTRSIVPREAETLAAGLPYQVQARGRDYAALPASLRAYYTYTLYGSTRDRQLNNPLFALRQSLPSMAGKRLTLSFEPATDADRQLIESRLPAPDDNGDIDPSQLPDSLPGYLIRLTAQLKLDGQVIEQVGSFALGHELSSTSAITKLDGGEHISHNELIAGEFHALGIHYPSGPQEDLDSIQQRLEATRDKIDSDQLDTLTKDTLIGDLLHAGINSYFAAIDAQTRVLDQAQPVSAYNNPGFGTFNTILEPQYRFGIAFNVGFGGIGVDVDAVISNVVAHNNNPDTAIQTIQLLGTQASALEHRIPELLYTDPNNPGEAFSAVKALTTAASQGQTLYTIDSGNLEQALSQISAGQDIKQDIRVGINAGRIATIHQNPVTVGGTTGFGYTIIDPRTGAGAYRISGGASGGSLSVLLAGITGFLDGQTAKRNNLFHSQQARLAARYSGLITVAVLLVEVADILSNSSLSPYQKAISIFTNLVGVALALGITRLVFGNILLASANPLLLGIFLAIIIGSVAIHVNLALSEI